jgi:thioredoxin-related protein
MKILLGFLTLIFSMSLLQAEVLISYDSKLKADGKNVMLILGSKSCPYCEILKKDITKNGELSSLIEGKMNVYYIPIDEQKNFEIGDKTPAVQTTSLSLKMQFGSRVTPTVVMFDKNWNKIIQLPGYADPSQMKLFLNYLNNDIYKDKDLTSYLKEAGLI